MKTKTNDQFIFDANKIHCNRYSYSKTNYKTNKDKVCIICNRHGEFWQTPSNHLKGQGCPKCAHEYVNNLKVISTKEYIKRANKKHNNYYDYSKTNYSGFDSNVIITCPIHGDFTINAHVHVSNGQGCPKCGHDNRVKKKLSTTNKFIQKAKVIHNNYYDYSKVQYINAKTNICIICPKHGEFLQTPNKHLQGHKCQYCKQSQGEMLVTRILTELKIPFKTEASFKSDLFNRIFRIDFVIDLDKETYFIEYNGMQHYYISEQFGGKDAFRKQLMRNKQLRLFTKINNFHLLEIKYNIDEDTVKQYIKDFLNVPANNAENRVNCWKLLT